MSFSFGFTDPDEGEQVELSRGDSTLYPDALDSPRLLASDVLPAHHEDVDAILQSLRNVRVSFESFECPGTAGITLHRRELFDIKHQLMGEADLSNDGVMSNAAELEILMGEQPEDIRPNVYEGGLKSWECSLDLVKVLSESSSDRSIVLELGCGTAMPSQYIFMSYLASQEHKKGLTLILADYNQSVLRLATLPNLIISWAKSTLSKDQWIELQAIDVEAPTSENEILLTDKLLQAFAKDLKSKGIYIELISGTWGREFNDLVKSMVSSSNLQILTSETIYQPKNLPLVCETLLEFLQVYSAAEVYVAAKDIYFGVGGSVVDFTNYMNQRVTQMGLKVRLTALKVDSLMGRSVIHIN